MKSQKWFVYMIEATNGNLYTGITTNLKRRFNEHLNSRKGAKFFKLTQPKKIVFNKRFPNRSSASKYEYYIKQLSRKDKLLLVDKRLTVKIEP